jgi:hypothetical protein
MGPQHRGCAESAIQVTIGQLHFTGPEISHCVLLPTGLPRSTPSVPTQQELQSAVLPGHPTDPASWLHLEPDPAAALQMRLHCPILVRLLVSFQTHTHADVHIDAHNYTVKPNVIYGRS